MKMTYITHTTSDKQTTTVLKFDQSTQLVHYRGATIFPLHTQCVVEVNGLIQGVGKVVKHYGDVDNPRWAYIYSAKKALKETTVPKEVRSILWKQLLDTVKLIETYK